jgi:methylase of polypeptide subunit release factors
MVAQIIFGVDLTHVPRQYLFDLTTVLLRKILKARIDPSMDVLEIGVGKFAILATSLIKSCHVAIDGVEISHECVKYARDCVARNKSRVRVWQSDVFSNISPKEYDVIFWNLPYLGPMWGVVSGYDRINYLHPLFKNAAKYLKKEGELIIGFNNHETRITTNAVLEILTEYKTLVLKEIKTWRWNKHTVLIIEHADASASG